MSPYEWAGALLGILSVVLLAKNLRWGWWIQNASSAAYLVVFYQSQLFILVGLQLFFIVIATWAWWRWNANSAQNQQAVKRLPSTHLVAYGGLIVALMFGMILLTRTSGTAAPFSEAFVSAASIVAQWLMSRHYIETWVLWFFANGLMAGLSWQSDLKLTAALYAVFVGLAVTGWKSWRE